MEGAVPVRCFYDEYIQEPITLRYLQTTLEITLVIDSRCSATFCALISAIIQVQTMVLYISKIHIVKL